MIARVVALLAVHLAAGSLLVTSLLALRNDLPESFVRFCSATAGILAVGAFFLGGGPPMHGRIALAVVAIGWYLTSRRGVEHKTLILVCLLVSLAVLGGEAKRLADSSVTMRFPLAALGSFSSALLLGAVSVSMILGHWYLVAPGLAITPLKQGSVYVWTAVAFRWLAVSVAASLGGWEALHITRLGDVFFSTTALFFFVRALIGLASPLLLAGLIWQTVKMRSTQSATGLLYVATFLVLFGELIAQFLVLATGFPL